MAGLAVTIGLWLLFLCFLLLSLFYVYVKYVFKYFEKRGIPFETPTFPFGNLADIFLLKKSIALNLADIYAKNKDHKMVGFFSLWRKQILIRDPEIFKNVLIKDFDVFQNRGIYFNKDIDPLSAHLFTLEGDDWKFLRAKLTPTFTSGKLKGMYSIILDCAKQLTDFVEVHNNTVECQSMFSKFALTIISATAFGLESNCMNDENSTFFYMTKKMVEPTAERVVSFVLMFNHQVAKSLNVRVVPELVSKFFMGLVKDTIQFRERTGITRQDYLQQLIDLRNSTFEGATKCLTEEEMAAQAFMFIVAGSETTSTTMSSCLFELARHPQIQSRLHQELDALSEITYETVQGCQYLDMVFKETLRKHVPFGFLNRECSRDYRVPNTDVIIQKGTQIFVSVQGMHNDPDLFPNPDEFNPERFSKENKDDIRPYTYMPFGDGQRNCIGMRFGLMVIKTGLATLLRRFEVCSKDIPTSLKEEPRTVITTISGGLCLTFKDRKLT